MLRPFKTYSLSSSHINTLVLSISINPFVTTLSSAECKVSKDGNTCHSQDTSGVRNTSVTPGTFEECMHILYSALECPNSIKPLTYLNLPNSIQEGRTLLLFHTYFLICSLKGFPSQSCLWRGPELHLHPV